MNNNNTIYKDSPLGKIPCDWEVIRISDYGKVYTGNTPPTNDLENYGVEFLFVSPSDLGSNKYILNTEKKLSKKGFTISRKFPRGSVLFTCIGSTIGKSGVASVELTSNQQINAVVVDEKYSNEFLYYALEKDADKIKLLAGEQAVPILNKSQFESVRIICPPLSEQKAIAHILGLMDLAINKNNQLITKKELQKNWLMQNLLTGKKRLKGFEKTKWHLKSLEEVAEFKNGKAHENAINENGEFIVVNSKFISTEGEVFKCSNENLCPLYIDDIVMVMSDIPNGKALAKCFYINENEKYTLNQRICSIKAFEFTDCKFLFYILNRNVHYLSFDNGVGQTNLRKEEVLECPLIMPEKEEQTAIAQVLQAADKEIQLLKTKTEKLRKQKKGLMQQLLTGKKRLAII